MAKTRNRNGKLRGALKTKTKSSLFTNVRPTGSGATMSRYYSGPRLNKTLYNLCRWVPNQVEIYTDSVRLTQACGLQTQQNYGYLLQSQLSTILGNVPPSTNVLTSQLLIKDVTAKYMFTNQDQGNVFIDIYEITPRRDTSNAALQSPMRAFSDGITDENGALASNTLGTNPFQSIRFTHNFVIQKVYHLELGCGRSHCHYSNYKINKVINSERTQWVTDNVAGYTKWVLINVWGSPINDATTTTNVSTGQIALDIVRSGSINYAYIPNNSTKIYNNSTLPTIVSEKVMDSASGTAVTDTPA